MRLNKTIVVYSFPRYIKPIAHALCVFICATQFMSCGVYSFTGTTLSPEIKNISVANFTNDVGGGPANINQQFTEKLKEYYQQNSTLKIASPDANADLQLEGAITGYDVSPIAPTQGQNGQLASLNRLTIRVQVRFVNTKNEEENFESPFSFYGDFDQNQSLSQVEAQLINEIFEKIVFDIFNKSVANW